MQLMVNKREQSNERINFAFLETSQNYWIPQSALAIVVFILISLIVLVWQAVCHKSKFTDIFKDKFSVLPMCNGHIYRKLLILDLCVYRCIPTDAC